MSPIAYSAHISLLLPRFFPAERSKKRGVHSTVEGVWRLSRIIYSTPAHLKHCAFNVLIRLPQGMGSVSPVIVVGMKRSVFLNIARPTDGVLHILGDLINNSSEVEECDSSFYTPAWTEGK